MKKSINIWLIVASALAVSGIITFIGALAMAKFNFSIFLTAKHETNTHEISEEFNSISINTLDADISFLPSEDDTCKVICYENPKMKHSVYVSDGTLTIDCVNERKWYDHIHIGINSKNPMLTVYIPAKEYTSLYVKSQTSDVGIPSDFSFDDIDISVSTGDVKCYASASNSVNIKASTGEIELEGVCAKNITLRVSTGEIDASSVNCEENLDITVKTGKAEIDGVICQNLSSEGTTGKLFLTDATVSGNASIKRNTGDVTLTSCLIGRLCVETSTGRVILDACDAEELSIKTDTGDVRGTLLSEKIFFTKTDTGDVDVPRTTNGGTSDVTTDTGDIIFSIISE